MNLAIARFFFAWNYKINIYIIGSGFLFFDNTTMSQDYQIQIEQDENGIYIWEIVGLPACYTQWKTISELLDRLMEVAKWSIAIQKNQAISLTSKFSLHIEYA